MKLFSAFLLPFFVLLINTIFNQNSGSNSHFFYSVQKNHYFVDTINLYQNDKGNPYITNYQFGFSDQQICAIEHDKAGELIFAQRQGITIYNGDVYKNLRLQNPPLCLRYLEDKNIILVGCKNDYGYLKKANTGEYSYFSLKTPKIKVGEITDIKTTNSYIYYYSDESIICHDKNTLKINKAWYGKKGQKHHGMFQFGSDVYLNKQNTGLLKFNSDEKKSVIFNSKVFSHLHIRFSFYLSDNELLIGTEENKLYIFDGSKISEYKFYDQKYLDNNQLVGGIDLSQQYYALSTLYGGIIIVNKQKSRIESVVNYQNGLPDDEIFAMGKDLQEGLWISHGFGISRLNYQLPIKDYSQYPGIEGNIFDITEFNSTIYIATTQGIYYLDTIKDVKEFEIYTKKQKIEKEKVIEESIVPVEEIQTEIIKEKPVESVEKKKGFLQRWKENREKRKKEREKEKDQNETVNPKKDSEISVDEKEKPLLTDTKTKVEEKKTGNSAKDKYLLKKQKRTKILSLSYAFKKVKDIDVKCRQIVKTGNGLLIASNNGLYGINNGKSELILKKRYITSIESSARQGLFYIGTDNGITTIKFNKNKWEEQKKILVKDLNDPVYCLSEDKDQNLWIAGGNLVYKVFFDKNLAIKSYKTYKIDEDVQNKISIRQINNQTYFILSRQIFKYDPGKDKIVPDNQLLKLMPNFSTYILSQNGINWFFYENKWIYLSNTYQLKQQQLTLLSLFENIQNISIGENLNLWLIDGKNKIYKIEQGKELDPSIKNFNVFLDKIQIEKGPLIPIDNINIPVYVKSVTLKINAPFYLRPESIKYQYFIEGKMNDWSEWKTSPTFDFLVYPGIFKIRLRAMNIFGDIAESDVYILHAQMPVWEETWFVITAIVLALLILTLLVILVIKRRERKLQRDKKRLENKVAERTAEISMQKEQLEYKNKEITDSLNYASQIQAAVLPPIRILKDSVDEYFIINKPKDIVSGDFYWVANIQGKLIVTVGDCTGHGVPGAFLSLLGVTYLNEIFHKIETLQANLVLEYLRARVINTLNQQEQNKKRLDGIDLSLAILDLTKMELQFAGANNPIYIVRNGHLTEFKGNRMPIGVQSLKSEPFTNHIIEVKKGDNVYLFSDGYTDQFGGELGRKFLSRNFKVLITEICHLNLIDQKRTLLEAFNLWKGNFEQIDDVLIIGFKI